MMLDRPKLSKDRHEYVDRPREVGHVRRVVARVALILLATAGLYQGV
jgi:hypothetical protein